MTIKFIEEKKDFHYFLLQTQNRQSRLTSWNGYPRRERQMTESQVQIKAPIPAKSWKSSSKKPAWLTKYHLCVFAQPLCHEHDVTQDQFLRKVKLVQNFPSS